MFGKKTVCRCLQQNVVWQYRYVNTGTSTLSKVSTTDLIPSACVKLSSNAKCEHAALEHSVDSEFLLSDRLFLHI